MKNNNPPINIKSNKGINQYSLKKEVTNLSITLRKNLSPSTN